MLKNFWKMDSMETSKSTMDIENATPEQRIEMFRDCLSKRRTYWMEWVQEMNKCLKHFDKLDDLQTEVFSRRQEAVEEYHSMAFDLAKRAKIYNEKYAEVYNKIRLMKVAQGSTTFMYNTEKAIAAQIDAQLSQDKYIIDMVESQLQYLDNTIKTIDGIIYAIPNRIKIEEIRIGR